MLADHFARQDVRTVEYALAVIPHKAGQPPETVDLRGEFRRDFVLEHREIVGETQRRATARAESDARLLLLA